MTWKCPECGSVSETIDSINCKCKAKPEELFFCKTCNSDPFIKSDKCQNLPKSLEKFHLDQGHVVEKFKKKSSITEEFTKKTKELMPNVDELKNQLQKEKRAKKTKKKLTNFKKLTKKEILEKFRLNQFDYDGTLKKLIEIDYDEDTAKDLVETEEKKKIKKKFPIGRAYCKECKIALFTDNEISQHSEECGVSNVVDISVGFVDPDNDDRNTAKKIVDYAMSKIDKMIVNENDSNEVFGIINFGDYIKVVPISAKSGHAIKWLDYSYNKEIDPDNVYSDDVYKNALRSIKSTALMNGTEKQKVHVRVAFTGDAIWYDLANSENEAVKVTKKGVDIVKLDKNAPIFIKFQRTYEQVKPSFNNPKALDNLCKLLNLKKKQWGLFKVHLITKFLEESPIPILVRQGTAGSYKTTFTASIICVIDPKGKLDMNNVYAMPEKIEDMIIQLKKNYCLGYENISDIGQEKSDTICRAITGASNTKRSLYTDEDESVSSYMRKMVLNGVVPRLDYTDLQSRIINYERDENSQTISREEYWNKFEELLPDILGQVFTILSKTLKLYPKIAKKIKPRTRMADFETWGEVIGRVLGYDKEEFLDMYSEKLSEEQISIQDSYPIVECIIHLMEREGARVIEDTATNMLKELTIIAENEFNIETRSKYVRFPNISNKLVRDLVVVNGLLKNNRIKCTLYHYNKRDGIYPRGSSMIRFEKLEFSSNSTLSNFSPSDSSLNTDRDTDRDKKSASLSKNDNSRHKKSPDRDDRDDRDTSENASDRRKISRVGKPLKPMKCRDCSTTWKTTKPLEKIQEEHQRSHKGHVVMEE